MHFLHTLQSLITHHSGLAYGAVFLISLSESLVLVGLLVPGTVIMFGVGAVVATGSLGLAPVLLLAMVGAVAGDGVSFWLGRHYKESLVNTWPFSRYPAALKKGAAFFHRHGGKSVLFGRFVGPVRPVIPVVAGMLGMGPAHFSVVNVLSAIGWALVYILPGLFFGTSLAMAGAVSARLSVVVFVLITAVWGFIWGCRRAAVLFERKGPAWFRALRQWSMTGTSTPRLARPVKRFFLFLLFRGQGEELLVVLLTVTLLVAGWGFFGVLQDVLARDPLVIADQAVYHFFQSLRTAWGDRVFVAITELGDSFVDLSLASAVLLGLLFRRCYRTAGFWALAVLGGVMGVQLLKWAVHLPRPVAIYHGASVYGFPSGHTTMSVVLYGFLAILLVRDLSGARRWGMFSFVFLVSFVIGFSRLYLGAHWLSDVLGGYFIGASWTAIMGIAWMKKTNDRIPRGLLGLTAALVVVVAGSWHVILRHERDLVFYAPRHSVKTIALSSWQVDGWRDLPVRRIDMDGEPEQPLTLQWAGTPADLARFLTRSGWQRPSPLSLKSFLGMFSPDTPLARLPVLPRLHDGRTERLRLFLMDQDIRFVLRLWPSDLRIQGNDAPLFVGALEIQHLHALAGLVSTARDTGAYDRALNLLQQTFGQSFYVLKVHRMANAILSGHEHRGSQWRGEVLLAAPALHS